jgi:predicted methyltransferase
MIHPNSIKTRHFLAIAEFFIRINQPKTYIVEPDLQCNYHPDVYMVYKNEHVCIEIQLTHISNKKMQKKLDEWVNAYESKKHYAKKLWIVTDQLYKLTVPEGFRVEYHRWNLDKEKEIEL